MDPASPFGFDPVCAAPSIHGASDDAVVMKHTAHAGCEKCHDPLHHCNNKLGNLGSHLMSGLRGGGRRERKIWEKLQQEELLDEITDVMDALEERERRHQEGIPEEDTSSSELPDSPSDSSLYSSPPSHPDDLEPHGPATWPDLEPKFTAYNRIMMYELWPGTGELPRAGQTLRIRWNVASKVEDLLQPAGRLAGEKPWKGDSKLMGGSWVLFHPSFHPFHPFFLPPFLPPPLPPSLPPYLPIFLPPTKPPSHPPFLSLSLPSFILLLIRTFSRSLLIHHGQPSPRLLDTQNALKSKNPESCTLHPRP